MEKLCLVKGDAKVSSSCGGRVEERRNVGTVVL